MKTIFWFAHNQIEIHTISNKFILIKEGQSGVQGLGAVSLHPWISAIECPAILAWQHTET
jgi:hypothetical protein